MLPLLFGLGTWEIVAIVLVVLLLFGANKIPQIMRNVGKGVNSFKQGMNDLQEEIEKGPDSKKSVESKKEE